MYWSSPKLIKRVLLQKVAFVACCILLLLEFKTKWMDFRVFQLHSYTATQLCVVARRGTSLHRPRSLRRITPVKVPASALSRRKPSGAPTGNAALSESARSEETSEKARKAVGYLC